MSTDRAPGLDPGRQPERTVLAWYRTVMALALGPLVAARLLVPERGAVSAAAVAGGLLVGLYVGVRSGVRHRRIQEVLTGAVDPRGLPGAGLLLVTAAVPLIGGLVAAGLLLGLV